MKYHKSSINFINFFKIKKFVYTFLIPEVGGRGRPRLSHKGMQSFNKTPFKYIRKIFKITNKKIQNVKQLNIKNNI